MEDIGCEFREMCDAYTSEKYIFSPILKSGFKKSCDTTPKEFFIEEFCPMYNLYEGLLGYAHKLLSDTNEKLGRTIKDLEEPPIKSISE